MKHPLPGAIVLTLVLFFAFTALVNGQPSGWSYVQHISITENSGTTLINYQIPLTINTQALISAGQMNAAGNDILFGKDCAGTMLYDYWIDTAINTANTVIWVKVDTLYASSSRTIYLFYGNPSAAAASSITGTFIGPFSSTDSITGGTNGGSFNSQRGFRFSPNEDIVVTEFGKYEPTGSTRYLTLFDYSTQAVLQQIQVSGAASVYNYAPLSTRMWLSNGVQYVMELYQGPSDGYYYGLSSQINSRLTYLDMRYCNSCLQSTFPTNVLTGYQYGYPDFLFYTKQSVTPAPTYVLSGSGSLHISAPSPVSECAGVGAVIGDTATGATGTVVYSWTPGTGLSDSTIAEPIATPPATQTYILTARNGACNSASATIIVNVHQPSLHSTAVSICPGSSYSFRGNSYSNPGTYNDTIVGGSVYGCDSIVSLALSYKTQGHGTVTTSICPGSSYTIGSHSYTNPGNYTDTITGGGANGCDSLVSLTLSYETQGHSTVTASICPGSSYTIGSHSYSSPGNYTDTITGGGANGCDSLVNLVLSYKSIGLSTLTGAICQGSSYTFMGSSYTAAGTYYDTVAGGSANGCDSLVVLILTVNPPPNPVIVLSGTDTLTAGSFGSYQWFYNDTAIGGATLSSYVALNPGSYRVLVVDSSGCSDTSAVFTQNPLGISIARVTGFHIYPNPNTGSFTLTVPTQYIGGQFSICDLLGRRLLSLQISKDVENIEMGDIPSGIYFLTVGHSSVRFTVAR